MSYERRWGQAATLCVAVAVGISTLLWAPLVTVAAVALTSIPAFAALEVLADPAPRPARLAGRRLRRLLGRALTIGGGLVGLVALLAVSPPVTLSLLLLLGLTSPPFVRVLRGRSPPMRGAPARPPGALPSPRAPGSSAAGPPSSPSSSDADVDDELRTSDVTRLCVQLRRTFWELREASDAEQVLRLVARRQRIIDELTRRDPDAMAVWLRSGARASGSPEKYFRARPRSDGPDPT